MIDLISPAELVVISLTIGLFLLCLLQIGWRADGGGSGEKVFAESF